MKTKLSKALSLILAVILAFGAMLPAFAADEIPEGYTPIYTAEDLNNIRNNISGSYILMNDIDLSAYENWEPIGTKEASFAGILDGNSKIISNLKITSVTDEGYAGLFGYIKKAEIKNLTVDGNIEVYPEIVSYVGLLCGEIDGSSVSSSVSLGAINAHTNTLVYAGGIAGGANKNNGSIVVTECVNIADISIRAENSTKYRTAITGGLFGLFKGSLSESVNHGNITAMNLTKDTDEQLVSAGGIVGYNNGLVLNCYNTGKVCSEGYGYLCVGGISGYWTDYSDMKYLYNRGEITEKAEGDNEFDTSVGAITGHAEGTLHGMEKIPDIYYSYYLNTTENPVGDDSGHYDSETVGSLTDEEMKNQTSFVGFDFDTVWVMEEGGYPVLRNQPIVTVKEVLSLKKGDLYAANIITVWTSSDTTVAVVNENGEIEATGAGTAIITVIPEYNYYIEYTVTVTDSSVIPEPEPEPEPEPQTKCPLLWIVNLIKKNLNFVVDLIRKIF